MTWAFKRQIFYILVLFAFLFIFGFLIIYPSFNKAPSCSDGIQNGDETGMDCGGSCPTACVSQVAQISILWSHSFEVVPGRYNAVAYLENHNTNDAVAQITYRFRFADAGNLYIGKREGTSYVPPGGKFAVFEPAVDMGNSTPVYTTFEFTETPVWTKVSADKINQLKVLVSDIKLQNPTTAPALSATVKNNSIFTIPQINVIALLYDAKGNALSASHTYIDTLPGGANTAVNFTWPKPIVGNVVTEEIIPIFNIFSVNLNG